VSVPAGPGAAAEAGAAIPIAIVIAASTANAVRIRLMGHLHRGEHPLHGRPIKPITW